MIEVEAYAVRYLRVLQAARTRWLKIQILEPMCYSRWKMKGSLRS